MGKRFILKINRNRCKGCKLCVDVCPQENLSVAAAFNKLGYHYVEATGDKCNGCRKCTLVCPDVALELFLEDEPAPAAEEKKPVETA